MYIFISASFLENLVRLQTFTNSKHIAVCMQFLTLLTVLELQSAFNEYFRRSHVHVK